MSVESTVRAVTTYRLTEMKQRGEKIAMLTSYCLLYTSGRGREDLPGLGGVALSFRQEDFRADDVRQIRKIGKVRFPGGEYLCRRDEEQTSHDSRLSAADQHRRRIHPDPSGRNARPAYAGRGVVVFALPFPPYRFGLSGRAAGGVHRPHAHRDGGTCLLYTSRCV